MKVGFDISQIAHPGGVSTYTKNLSEKLIEISNLEMVFFYSSLRKRYGGSLSNVKTFSIPPILVEIMFNQIRLLSIENFIGQVDIFHSSDWVQPKTRAKKITTYHDVVPLKYPQWSHPKIVEVHKRRLKLVEKEINMVIAVSETTKRDLLEVSNIPEEKIVVIYEGVEEIFKPQDDKKVAEFRKKLGLPEKYIMAMGGIGERKNIDRLKEAAKKYNLAILGQHTPYIPADELPIAYSAATVLVYPSLYEGFGLPILEAMACGTPVITSNTSSMPEVGGNAASYIDPLNVGQMEEAISEVMEDKAKRDEMIKKGFAQVKKFSWKKCAQDTYNIYQLILNK